MSWIKEIAADAADEKLQQVYRELSDKRGKISHIMSVQSLNPEAMKAHLDLYTATVFGKSKLKRYQREMIAIVVSRANNCQYCIQHHAEALNFYWKDSDKVEQFCENYLEVSLPAKEVKMLQYAEKLTRDSAQITETDISGLRDVRFSDEEILNINLIASYFNFVNRLANGLGVQFSEAELSGYKF